MKCQDPRQTVPKRTSRSIDDLFVVMERLERLHDDLRQELSNKLEHMRRADHAGVAACVQREQALTMRINEQEGLRKQVMEQVGRRFGIAPERARTMPARQLAGRITQPYRGRLLERADRLCDVLAEVKKLNCLIGRVSADVLAHVRELFSTITSTAEPGSGYSSSGQTVELQPLEVFSTIG